MQKKLVFILLLMHLSVFPMDRQSESHIFHIAKRKDEGAAGVLTSLLPHESTASVTARNSAGQTALHVVAKSGNVTLLATMLSAIPALVHMINERDVSGNTALHYAAESNPSVVAQLLRYGANAEILDAEGCAARVRAANGAIAAVFDRYGVSAGRQPLYQPRTEESFILQLAERKDEGAAGVLKSRLPYESTASVTARNSAGQTALHVVAKKGNVTLLNRPYA